MSTSQATGQLVLLYGSIHDAYKIVDRVGMAIEPVNLVMGANRRPTGVRGLYAWYRVGAAVVVDQAVRLLKQK